MVMGAVTCIARPRPIVGNCLLMFSKEKTPNEYCVRGNLTMELRLGNLSLLNL